MAEAAEIDLTAVLAGPAALCRTGRLALATGALHGDGLAVALGEDERTAAAIRPSPAMTSKRTTRPLPFAGIVLRVVGLDLDISVAAGAGAGRRIIHAGSRRGWSHSHSRRRGSDGAVYVTATAPVLTRSLFWPPLVLHTEAK